MQGSSNVYDLRNCKLEPLSSNKKISLKRVSPIQSIQWVKRVSPIQSIQWDILELSGATQANQAWYCSMKPPQSVALDLVEPLGWNPL